MVIITRAIPFAVLVALLPVFTGAAGFDTDPYARVLETFVDDAGRVDYAALAEDRADLDTFVAAIAGVNSATWAGFDTPQRLAWWLNTYNALTLQLIVDRYPIKTVTEEFPASSIRQIEGAWTQLTHTVMGMEMTLDEMEHEIVRILFDEARVHMALVCAAVSCPPLRREPYTGARLDDQLEEQSTVFVTDPRNVRIDRENHALRVSAIFDWFGGDFVDTYDTGEPRFDDPRDRAIAAFVARFVSDADRAWLGDGDYRILYLGYDWNLNDRKR